MHSRRRNGNGVARVRESVRNAAQNREEFLTGLRERAGIIGGSDGGSSSPSGSPSDALRGIRDRLDQEDHHMVGRKKKTIFP